MGATKNILSKTSLLILSGVIAWGLAGSVACGSAYAASPSASDVGQDAGQDAASPAASPQVSDQASDDEPSPRLEHARELLGRHFDRAVAKTADRSAEVRRFVRRITKDSLSKKWKHRASRIARAILKESARYGFDPIFLVSVIQTESSFSPTALGSAGEIGLMQLRPETGKWIAEQFDIRWHGKKTLYDPIQNIRIGAAYLSMLREKFDRDGRLYIPAYNMGPTALRDAVADRDRPVDYARRVMSKYLKNYSKISLELEQKRVSHAAHDRKLSADRARELVADNNN